MTQLANHVHFGHDGVVFGASFGDFHSVTSVNIPGNGHHPHIEVRSKFGLRLDLSPEFAVALIRELPAAIAKVSLPRNVRHIRDAVGGSHE